MKDLHQSETYDTVKSAALKSVKWSALGEIFSRFVHPVIALALARILAPADFGIVGVAMIVIGFAQIVWDFGLSKTLIQREENLDDLANVVFWINTSFSLLIYLALFAVAPRLSEFFRSPEVVDVVRALSLLILTSSLTAVHRALFQRRFQFKRLFKITAASVLVPGFISIPLALNGYGAWSIVYGTLLGGVLEVCLFWWLSPWKPHWGFNFVLAKDVLGFGAWIMGEAFLLWMIGWGDSVVLGHFLGMEDLGVYRVGITFLTFVFGSLLNHFLPVIYSSLSRLQATPASLTESFLRIIRLIALISLPVGVCLVFLAPSVSSAIFGLKWKGIEVVISVLGLMQGIGWVVGPNHELYRAIGRPDVNTKLTALLIVYYLPVYIWAAPHGLYVFCIARAVVGVSSILFYLFFSRRVLGFPWTYLWKPVKSPFIASVAMGGVVFFLIHMTGLFDAWGAWSKFFGILFFGSTTYISVLLMMEKKLIMEYLALAKQSVR